MKISINQVLLIAIKKNLLYITIFLVFIIIGIYFIPKLYDDINQQKLKIGQMTEEVELKKKQLNDVVIFPATNINKKIITVDRFLPLSEDYFSIFNSIDNISQQTGLIIDSYTSPYGRDSGGLVNVTIQGIGTYSSFNYFLSKYNYVSKRLMTIGSIKYYPMINSFTVDVAFYSREAKLKTASKSREKLIDILSKIDIEYQGVNLDQGSSKEIDINYTSKTDPFQK